MTMYNALTISLQIYEKKFIEVLFTCDFDDEHNVINFFKINCKKYIYIYLNNKNI